jgi:DNA-binding NarL/FixJ family response regulator
MMIREIETEAEAMGLVWIDCPFPLAAIGLARILENEVRVHTGREPPKEEDPSIVVFGVGGLEGLLEGVKRIRRQSPDALVLVFGLYLDMAAARVALRAGARGYIHAGMQPSQIVRALKVAGEGQIVAPRQLLEYLITNEEATDLGILTKRQREILEIIDEGLTNAQIAKRLFLTESTVKQHLRAAYKILGVSNRTEAAKLIRNGD